MSNNWNCHRGKFILACAEKPSISPKATDLVVEHSSDKEETTPVADTWCSDEEEPPPKRVRTESQLSTKRAALPTEVMIVTASAEPEVDFMKGHGLWKTEVHQLLRIRSVSASDRVSSTGIRDLFDPAPQDLKKVLWMLVSSPCVADVLQEKLPGILFDMAKDQSTILIYKANCANIRSCHSWTCWDP